MILSALETKKSDRVLLPYLWTGENVINLSRFEQHFHLATPSATPEAEYNILALKDEASIRQTLRKIQHLTPTAEVRIFPAELLQFETEIGLLMKSQPVERWLEIKKDEALEFPDAQAIARSALQSLHAGEISQSQWNIEKEELRQRCGLNSFDWNKYIADLEAEIHAAVDGSVEKATDPDERLKLELKALLKETDFIKRMRRRAQIACHHNIKISDIDQALKHLDESSKSKEPRRMGLDELFDLPQVGIEYVIPGMLPVGETALLVASPKAGKSLLAYDAAFAVATGEDSFLGEQVKQGKVLIVQCDESVNTAKGRLIKRGFRHEDATNVQFVDSFKISQLDLLEEWLESFRPTLVIVDSLRRISAGRQLSENSAEFADAVYQLKELIARYNAAAILIHHTNKNQEAVGVERVRGSSAIAGAVWGVWELAHVLSPDPNNKKRMVIDPKDPTRILNITARDVEGQRLRIELDPENNHWLSLGEVGVEDSEINQRKTHEDKILELLKPIAPKGLEASEINERLTIGRGVYNCLHRLLAKGIIGSRPSAKDRRRTVYYYPKNNQVDFLPPPPPTPTDQNVIEYPETLTQYGLDNRSQIDHKFDHKLITENDNITPVQLSNQAQATVSEVDHKSVTTLGGGGTVELVINPISQPSNQTQWNPGDKFRSTSSHKSYRKYLGKTLVVSRNNSSRMTVSAEGTRDEFSYSSIERT